MRLEIREISSGDTFRVKGELAGVNSLLLMNKVQAMPSAAKARITIDISSVTYIDSTSLGSLIYCHKLLEKQGKLLCLADTREHAQMLFRGCQLDRILNIVEPAGTVD
jgi:anti-anti-sigma factor